MFFVDSKLKTVFFQQLLNNCFDDIEKFVSRLQQAAEAYKELERRKYERGHRNKRKSAGGEFLYGNNHNMYPKYLNRVA